MTANSQDIRWIQRFNHFMKALAQLQEAVQLARQRPLSKLEDQGLIQAFEFTHELASFQLFAQATSPNSRSSESN